MRSLDEPTAGQLCLKASGDLTTYDPFEIAYGMTDDVVDNLLECAHNHESIFNEDEFFVILQKAKDPLLENIVRHKYYAYLFLPEPRPEQMVCLYKKSDQSLKRLWSLPNWQVMGIISEMPWVDAKWEETKYWCDAFFYGDFFQRIRDQHRIKHYSKTETLKLYEEKLRKFTAQDIEATVPQSRDPAKVAIDEIIDSHKAGSF